MADPTFDLQAHSTASDGTLAPAAVVAAAERAGVRLLALTDHDTVAGVDEALAAARDLEVVPAAEITSVDGELEDLHVLGYGIDHRDPALLAFLADAREDRTARAGHMLALLDRAGWALQTAAIDARREAGLPIGRPHLARAAFEHPANSARLAVEGLTTFGALLEAYLVPGAPAYLPRDRPTVAETIDAVHAAGGVAVWAHPFFDVADPAEVQRAIDRFSAAGLDGVEAFYRTYTREQTLLAADLCEARGLLTTGSSDFHGPTHPTCSRFRAFALHGRVARLGPIARG